MKAQTKRSAITEPQITDANSQPQAAAPAEEVATLAYEYWQARGCPEGCPEEDWYRAERELSARRYKAAN